MSTDGDDASPETRVAKIFDQMDKNNVSGGMHWGKRVKRRAGAEMMNKLPCSFFFCMKDKINNKRAKI